MVDALLTRYPLISDQIDPAELGVILKQLENALDAGVKGAVVEMGCYAGTATLFLRRLLDAKAEDRELHAYDSFEGLPPKKPEDGSPAGMDFQAGALRAGKAELVRNFHKAGLKPPIIHKGWFEELGAVDMPAVIAFAFLDGDFYSSIKASLALVGPRLAGGGVIVVDDYQSEQLPGARRAVDEWLRGKPFTAQAQASLAIITHT